MTAPVILASGLVDGLKLYAADVFDAGIASPAGTDPRPRQTGHASPVSMNDQPFQQDCAEITVVGNGSFEPCFYLGSISFADPGKRNDRFPRGRIEFQSR